MESNQQRFTAGLLALRVLREEPMLYSMILQSKLAVMDSAHAKDANLTMQVLPETEKNLSQR
jgi:hypothetical protein